MKVLNLLSWLFIAT